ncbi:helix-turn-helix transcriptional regulator [Enterocloster clostridioformis]
MYLNTNLSFLRENKALTQLEVAGEVGLSQKVVSAYERGVREPSLKNLIKIAGYFSVSIDDLLLKDLRPQGSILARNLKYLRNRGHFSQGDMARLLKISKANMGKYESGAAELSNQGLINVSEFFGVTVDDLLKKDLSKEGK